MLEDRSRRNVLFRGGWAVRMAVVCITVLVVAPAIGAEERKETKEAKKMTVGAYYFDGWAGRSPLANDPKEPWARTAPYTLTRRMIEEFPEREPIWGWRDDSPDIMKRQIDLAADHGLAFFAFCWYLARRRPGDQQAEDQGRPPANGSEVVPQGEEQPSAEILPIGGQSPGGRDQRDGELETGGRVLDAVSEAPTVCHGRREAAGHCFQSEGRG